MFYGISGFNTNSNSINPFQGCAPIGAFKHTAMQDWLSELSKDSLKNNKTKKVETFNPNGDRVLTYVNRRTKLPTQCIIFDYKTGNKKEEYFYEKGVLVKGGTFDPVTGQKLTNNHYVNGVLTQIDTLDANGKVISTRNVSQGGGSDDSSRYSTRMEMLYDPVTKLSAGWKCYDIKTGAMVANSVYINGNVSTATTYDLETHNVTSFIQMNPDTCQPVQTATYDPTTNNKLTEKLFDSKGNLTAFNTYDSKTGAQLTSSPTLPG